MPRGGVTNELIEALERGEWAFCKRLVHTQPHLLTGTNKMGYTPLMLLSMATWPSEPSSADTDPLHDCKEAEDDHRTCWKRRQAKNREYKARLPRELLDIMLEQGAARTAADKANHKTAADFAQSTGKEQLAKQLRALECPDLDCCCPHCGERLERRNKIVKMAERVASGEEKHPSVRRFFSDDEWAEARQRLADPLFHAVAHNHYPLSKELSESMAVISLLDSRLKTIDSSIVHIIDFCCGRSLTAAICALRFCGCPVTAVDHMKENMLPHYAEAGLDVTYLQHDILHESFIHRLRDRVTTVGSHAVLLGVHCCGFLSLAAVEAFKQIDLIESLVLMPCCLPSKRDQRSPAYVFETKDPDEQYKRWAAYLRDAVGPTASLDVATNVLSVKSAVIMASKSDTALEPAVL